MSDGCGFVVGCLYGIVGWAAAIAARNAGASFLRSQAAFLLWPLYVFNGRFARWVEG